jgi:hypothetical protein
MSDISTKKFNLNAIRAVSQNHSEVVVEKVLTTIRVGKPTKGQFFRVHPDADKTFDVYLYENGEKDGLYVVANAMVPHMEDTVRLFRLLLAVTRHGDPFLWALRLPHKEHDTWADSALAVAEVAKTHWTRRITEMANQCYTAQIAKGELGEPEWPVTPFEELIELGFKNRIIDSTDHILFQQLQGLR